MTSNGPAQISKLLLIENLVKGYLKELHVLKESSARQNIIIRDLMEAKRDGATKAELHAMAFSLNKSRIKAVSMDSDVDGVSPRKIVDF